METGSLSLSARPQSFSVSSSHHSIFLSITLVLDAVGLTGTGRVRHLIGLQGDLVWLCVCVWTIGHTQMLLSKWGKLCWTEVDKTKWAGITSNSLLGFCLSCLPDPLHTNKTYKEVIKAKVEKKSLNSKVYSELPPRQTLQLNKSKCIYRSGDILSYFNLVPSSLYCKGINQLVGFYDNFYGRTYLGL